MKSPLKRPPAYPDRPSSAHYEVIGCAADEPMAEGREGSTRGELLPVHGRPSSPSSLAKRILAEFDDALPARKPVVALPVAFPPRIVERRRSAEDIFDPNSEVEGDEGDTVAAQVAPAIQPEDPPVVAGARAAMATWLDWLPVGRDEWGQEAYSWVVPQGDGEWTLDDERTVKGDGLTSSERDPDGLWTIRGSLERWYPGASLDAMAGTGADSAAGLSAFLMSGAGDADKLLASQIGRLAWRFDASNYDGDFGDFPAAWEYPALEMDGLTVMEDVPVWRDPELWQARPIPHDEVLKNHRKAVTVRLSLVREEIASAEARAAALSAEDGRHVVDPVRGWRAYEAAGGPSSPVPVVGGIGPDRFAVRDETGAGLSREAMLAAAGLPGGEAGRAALLESARGALRFKRAEEIFLVWLSGFEDPMGQLSDCAFRRVRPWRALVEEAGYGDALPGRRVKSDPALAPLASTASDEHVEDVVARLLAPDGGALLNRFETACYWMEGAKPRFQWLVAEMAGRKEQGMGLDDLRPKAPAIHAAIARPGREPQATVPARDVAALGRCVPAVGSASDPAFQIPLGSVIVAIPGEPAYLRGDGWCVSPRGNIWFDDDPRSDRTQWVPFVERERGPRIAFYRGKRWVRDVDVHRDECVGERFWRVSRLQALQVAALGSDAKFGPLDFQGAFAPGRHPLERGMKPDSSYLKKAWLEAWPWVNRMPPPSVMWGASDLAGWRPSPMAFFDEQAGIWNPGPSRARRAVVDVLDRAPKEYGVGDWSRIGQNKAKTMRRWAAMTLRWEDFEYFGMLCAACGMRPQDVPPDTDLKAYFAERGYGGYGLAEGSPALEEEAQFIERLAESAGAQRERALSDPGLSAFIAKVDAACAMWREDFGADVPEARADHVGAKPGDSYLAARARIHDEMMRVRDRHADEMRAAGAMLVYVPPDGGDPIEVPWDGDFRPLAHDIRAEVEALEGAWASRRFSGRVLSPVVGDIEYGSEAFFKRNNIPYDPDGPEFAHRLRMRLKDYEREGLTPEELLEYERYDGSYK